MARGFDEAKNETFFRPLGGAIEFGEMAEDALRREISEELGVEITEPVRLGVLENVFIYNGQPGHEIVFVFDAKFLDTELYAKPSLRLNEPVWDGPAQWIDLSEPLPVNLYPEGLKTLLRS